MYDRGMSGFSSGLISYADVGVGSGFTSASMSFEESNMQGTKVAGDWKSQTMKQRPQGLDDTS